VVQGNLPALFDVNRMKNDRRQSEGFFNIVPITNYGLIDTDNKESGWVGNVEGYSLEKAFRWLHKSGPVIVFPNDQQSNKRSLRLFLRPGPDFTKENRVLIQFEDGGTYPIDDNYLGKEVIVPIPPDSKNLMKIKIVVDGPDRGLRQISVSEIFVEPD
jgi:hypothetical protein